MDPHKLVSAVAVEGYEGSKRKENNKKRRNRTHEMDGNAL
jgi:hypothetical protein